MNFKRFIKTALVIFIAVIMITSALPTVDKSVDYTVSAAATSYTMKEYTGPYSSVDGTYGGVDDLGRYLTADYSMFRAYLNKSVDISENERIEAADATTDGRLTTTDYLRIKRHCGGTFNIFS